MRKPTATEGSGSLAILVSQQTFSSIRRLCFTLRVTEGAGANLPCIHVLGKPLAVV